MVTLAWRRAKAGLSVEVPLELYDGQNQVLRRIFTLILEFQNGSREAFEQLFARLEAAPTMKKPDAKVSNRQEMSE